MLPQVEAKRPSRWVTLQWDGLLAGTQETTCTLRQTAARPRSRTTTTTATFISIGAFLDDGAVSAATVLQTRPGQESNHSICRQRHAVVSRAIVTVHGSKL